MPGSESVKTPTYRLHKELSFIKDTISNLVTSSNLTLSNFQQPSSQSQSAMSSVPILIFPAHSPMNTTIPNTNDSNDLYMPLKQQKNYHTLKAVMKKGKKIK